VDPAAPTPDRVEVPLLLARHGQTLDNANGLILGRRDPPLSAAGRDQAAQLARSLAGAGVALIWCSPLLRARQTAVIVGDALGCEPQVSDDLIESDRGEWEGVPVALIAQRTPALHAAFEAGDPDFTFPGGESIASQVARTRRALDDIAAATAAAGQGRALIVAHAGTIRAAMLAQGETPPPERLLAHGEAVALSWSRGDRAV
jgi:broad specificity phosphatase PhoE